MPKCPKALDTILLSKKMRAVIFNSKHFNLYLSMYNKIYILGFLMILNGIAAQSRTINTAIHAHIAIEAPATLAFFSPEVQFWRCLPDKPYQAWIFHPPPVR